jgi:hypothetical protein
MVGLEKESMSGGHPTAQLQETSERIPEAVA